jgi:hypothetical protein
MVRVRLSVLGPHTQIGSTVCAACPHSPAGCCTGPPPFDWPDVGRVVALGGRDWLLAELRAGRLSYDRTGLKIRRRRGLSREGGPRIAKCGYHGPTGCTISPDQRPATCNYYVCDAALGGASEAARAREVHAELAETFVAWEAELSARVARAYPDGPALDEPFLDWLGEAFRALVRGEGLPVPAGLSAPASRSASS